MRVLAVDVGSSSVKAGVFEGGTLKGTVARVPVRTDARGVRVEVPAGKLLRAVDAAMRKAVEGQRGVDAVSLDTFSPGVVVWDKKGRVLAGAITHQDRRSVEQAREIERRVGKKRHLRLAGNRPFPGGIGSSSLLWLNEHGGVWRRVGKIGQVSTLVLHALTGRWEIDPSQAAFLGLNDVASPLRWSDELCAAIGVEMAWLPRLAWADEVVGMVTRSASRRTGVPQGVPVIGGLVDTGAAFVRGELVPRQLLHNAGSTDVLALCVGKARPVEDVLTRPLGVGRVYADRWLAVSTIAASGSAVNWVRRVCFSEFNDAAWYALVEKSCHRLQAGGVTVTPLLAGDRTSLEQMQATISGLGLGVGRQEILSATLSGLVQASAARIERLKTLYRINANVLTMGGEQALMKAMHRAWGKGWRFSRVRGESLEGLAVMAARVLGT